MAAAAPLSASAPGRFAAAAHSPRFPTPIPASPLAYQEAECRDPPIYDNVYPIDMTPFNYAQLQHGYRAYISTLEKREMDEFGYRSLLTDSEIRETHQLCEAVRALRSGDSWEAACKGVGDTLAEADLYMELVLAKLGIAALYEHRDQLWGEATRASFTCFASPEFACEIRKRKEKLEDWIPVCWYKPNEAQEKMVLDEVRTRLAAVKDAETSAERSAKIRRNKQETKRRLSLEMKRFAEEMEAHLRDSVWLATQLRDYFGVDDIDTDNLPPLAELQERYNRADREHSEEMRRATLAPLPDDEESHNILLMFSMDSLESE